MKFKKILLTFLILVLIAVAAFLWRIAPEANGYTAKYLCSLTYTSGLDPEKGFEHYIKPMHFLFRGVVPEIDTASKEVSARFFGFLRPRTAVWREGCGCTLLVKSTAEELRRRHDVPHRIDRSIDTFNTLWPAGNLVSRDSIHASVLHLQHYITWRMMNFSIASVSPRRYLNMMSRMPLWVQVIST